MTDRSAEMAAFLMAESNRLYHAGKLDRRTLVQDLTAALRRRWSDVQLAEIEAASVKFGELADKFSSMARPANDRGRRH